MMEGHSFKFELVKRNGYGKEVILEGETLAEVYDKLGEKTGIARERAD